MAATPQSVDTSPSGDPHQNQVKPPLAVVDWAALVDQVKTGDDAAMEQLYKLFGRGIRYYLCRQMGPEELDDKIHDTFLIVVNAIKRGEVREPERLMGFVRTVVRRRWRDISKKLSTSEIAKWTWNQALPSRTRDGIPNNEPLSGKKPKLCTAHCRRYRNATGISLRDFT
jgi:hypothetical protein